jgi:hypothetical protein
VILLRRLSPCVLLCVGFQRRFRRSDPLQAARRVRSPIRTSPRRSTPYAASSRASLAAV